MRAEDHQEVIMMIAGAEMDLQGKNGVVTALQEMMYVAHMMEEEVSHPERSRDLQERLHVCQGMNFKDPQEMTCKDPHEMICKDPQERICKGLQERICKDHQEMRWIDQQGKKFREHQELKLQDKSLLYHERMGVQKLLKMMKGHLTCHHQFLLKRYNLFLREVPLCLA